MAYGSHGKAADYVIMSSMKELGNLEKLSHPQKDAIIRLLWEQKQLLISQNAQLQQRVAELEVKIKELEDRLNKNSQNSSQPPSSDGYTKARPKSQRKKTKRKPGGQPGHSGQTLRQVPEPDEVIVHSVLGCSNCGASLASTKARLTEKRQVFDIPPLQVSVTEHQAEQKCCPSCQHLNKADFPENMTQPAQYGARIKSLMVYLNQYQLIPYDRLREFFLDVFNQSLSVGSIAKANQAVYRHLETVESQIKERLSSGKLMHSDETGLRINKKGYWLHVASTQTLTHYAVHAKRGSEAMDAIAILPSFTGTLMHDHFKSYFRYAKFHALCNAHHLRELTGVQEQFSVKWAVKIEKLLLRIKQRVEDDYADTGHGLAEDECEKWRKKYMNIIYKGQQETPAIYPHPGEKKKRMKQTTARCLLVRLRQHYRDVLAFMYDPLVPFDNNQAERDIRMTKVQQKISGCFRTYSGAEMFCRIRGYISTAKKNDLSILTAIENAYLNQAHLTLENI